MTSTSVFERSVELPVDQASAFAYHDSPGALQRLLPPWESIEILSTDNQITVGSRVRLKAKVCGLPIKYTAKHTVYDPPHHFQDVQEKGPFAGWCHDHRFDAVSASQSRLTDHLEYRIPLGPLGKLLGSRMARNQLEAMFRYRHATTRQDLNLAAAYSLSSQRIGLSGATGLVGQQLQPLLQMLGHQVDSIVRHKADAADEIAVWDDAFDTAADANLEKLRRLDAVVHLAGKPIAAGRWSEQTKRQIRDSRVDKTHQLCQRLAALGDDKPQTLLCASATGIYGDRGDETLDEQSDPGQGFLADVAQQWEQACQPAVDAGIRVVHLRFGMILSPRGGALQKTLLPAKLGGGRLGSGRQWWSWIALDDVLGGIYHALATPELHGPVNFVAPQALTNAQFTAVLGKVLRRPTIVPAPAFALRLALGEMADALLLASARVEPRQLQQTGYAFRFPDLEAALLHLLGRNS
ncbi:TIGR01777 family oxidoreductase [Roseimaritima ulvae]|uniref:Epimerase family protein n=1 Tax=Roseimaritima ulvae TaxID=980254 RepID=A0A5B9QMR3_9BACT|nr:TIGR01777 family oxidoreductase [Roseimaritima ulvae]QEG40278.1 Epimerase family protein [Roseimaritima ulvae]